MTNEQIGVPNPATWLLTRAPERFASAITWATPPARSWNASHLADQMTRLTNRSEQLTYKLFGQYQLFVHGKGTSAPDRRASLKQNGFDSSLPEEQATEFEKFENITQLLRGLSRESF